MEDNYSYITLFISAYICVSAYSVFLHTALFFAVLTSETSIGLKNSRMLTVFLNTDSHRVVSDYIILPRQEQRGGGTPREHASTQNQQTLIRRTPFGVFNNNYTTIFVVLRIHTIILYYIMEMKIFRYNIVYICILPHKNELRARQRKTISYRCVYIGDPWSKFYEALWI